MEKTEVPGLAVPIVYKDKVVFLNGYGVRKAGERARVDPDTVFQLASLSKPISSTMVAALVGTHDVNWDDRIADLDSRFKLSDPSVSAQVTIRDFLSHRSVKFSFGSTPQVLIENLALKGNGAFLRLACLKQVATQPRAIACAPQDSSA
jgi:CubicO group peptidase (beta-lactamase class C family)